MIVDVLLIIKWFNVPMNCADMPNGKVFVKCCVYNIVHDLKVIHKN